MTKFTITETVACWVTFTHIIDAPSEEEARLKMYNGEGLVLDNPIIGDSLDGYATIIEVET